jgi:phosphoglycerol transferase
MILRRLKAAIVGTSPATHLGRAPASASRESNTVRTPLPDDRPTFRHRAARLPGRKWCVPASGAIFVTLIALWEFQIWNGGLSTPTTYFGDGLYYAGITKSIIEHGWYFTNPRLGAPLGQVNYDYPLGYDNLNLGAIRLLAWMFRNPFVVNNLFLYLTFPAVFLTSWFVLRRLGFSKPVAWVIGVVYTILPYHFWRADLHLMLAAYYAVPLGALLLYGFTDVRGGGTNDRDAWRELTAGSWRARAARLLRSRWFWIPVILGSTGVYYAAFFGFLAIAVGGLTALRDRDLRRLALPAICTVLVAAVLAINNAPTILYSIRHGSNTGAVERSLGESDIYGLNVSSLVLPTNNHRFPLFRDIKDRLNAESVSPVGDPEYQAIGLIASLGLVVSIGSVLMGVTKRRSGDRWSALRRTSGELNVLAILLAAIGGISTIVGLLGLTSLRAYNRISIFIAFFSLVALGALVQSWLAHRKTSRLQWSRRFTAGTIAVSLGVCAFAAFDQTPRQPLFQGQSRNQVKTRLSSDRAFAEAIERRVGRGAMVFELPLMEYPEAKVSLSAREPAYQTDELVKPSLFTTGVQWSWGAMKGRPEDLTPSFVGRPVEGLLPDLAAVGFDGIYIDRRGFADHGGQIEARVRSILDDQRPMLSHDGDLSFFDLRAFGRHLANTTSEGALQAQRSSTLNPLRLHWGSGFRSPFGDAIYPSLDGVTYGRWAENGAALDVTNPLQVTRHLMLHFGALAADTRPATLEVGTPRGTQRFDLSSNTPLTLELNVRPGKTRLTFRIDRDAPGTPTDAEAAFQIVNSWWEAPPIAAKPAN